MKSLSLHLTQINWQQTDINEKERVVLKMRKFCMPVKRCINFDSDVQLYEQLTCCPGALYKKNIKIGDAVEKTCNTWKWDDKCVKIQSLCLQHLVADVKRLIVEIDLTVKLPQKGISRTGSELRRASHIRPQHDENTLETIVSDDED